jgi:hypothetical protein
MNAHQIYLTSCLVAIAALLCSPSPGVAAGVAPDLGAAQSFAVLGAATVTNTGMTTITGDLGVSPGTAITGFPPGVVIGGTIHAGDAVAAQAHSDAVIAYNALVAQACDFNYSDVQELGGLTLTPGVHCFPSSAQVTGTLTLVGSGPFIFKIVSTLTTASNSSVVVIEGGQTCSGSNVFWAVGSSATLGTGTQFAGNILALISITLTTGANVSGSALALTGAVTMDTNQVSACTVPGGTFPPTGAIKVTGGGQIPVPDPDSADPTAGGTGSASFGFNARPNKQGGHFNYVNHVTGLHVNGPVTDIQVIAINPDGSPKTVRFSGTCDRRGPACSFSITVEDHGEPGRIDQLGIAVTGAVSEVRSRRIISRGNIQFHK